MTDAHKKMKYGKRYVGRVLWWSEAGGFGFIDCEGHYIFVHYLQVNGGSLQGAYKVSFTLGKVLTDDVALDVTVLTSQGE